MIKGLNSSGRYLQVNGGSPTSTYVNNYTNGQGVGNMRYNTSSQNMEVFDGNNWQQIHMNYASVELTHEAQELLDWAKLKRSEELKLQDLCKKHPGLQEAYERLKIMETLVLEEKQEINT